MGLDQASPNLPLPLASVICTEELNHRETRPPNLEAVTEALVMLARTLANSPERILQQLVETSLRLCSAQSSGLSLLEEEDGRKIFRWHGVAGEYAPHLWGTTPREFSPCGTVLDTDAVQLMSRLDRHYTYFAQVEPRIEEALLIPFHIAGKAVGTLWVISHDKARRFDAEDARVLSALGEFAAAAYQALSGTLALNSIIATVRDPLVVLDQNFRITTVSRSYYEAFQATPEVTEGRLLFEIGNGQWDIPALRASLEGLLLHEGTLENFEVARDFPGLGRRIMLLNARKLLGESNPRGLILLAIDDITTRKQKEDELLRSNEDSQRFAQAAAHDLRAPLHSSMALLELLDQRAEKTMEEGQRHLLSLVRTSLRRLENLMSDLLSYTEAGSAQNISVVPLEEPLQMALADLQKDIAQAGARVNCGAMPSLNTDRSLMSFVFQNLLSNALKFRSERPLQVQIAATKADEGWVISVADNGEGFDSQYAEQIFQPFERLHGRETPGSGIGLATCKRIIERLGGRIWAESTAGKGASFYFTLPAIRA
jgi:signal transduction histidine kinase